MNIPSDVDRFQTPYGIALDVSGHLYEADGGNQKIRKIS